MRDKTRVDTIPQKPKILHQIQHDTILFRRIERLDLVVFLSYIDSHTLDILSHDLVLFQRYKISPTRDRL